MKTNLRITLLAFLLVASLTGFQVKADDGTTTKTTKHTAATQKMVHPKRTEAAQTGIKAPPGVPIHPVVQSANIDTQRRIPTQGDYHTQQAF